MPVVKLTQYLVTSRMIIVFFDNRLMGLKNYTQSTLQRDSSVVQCNGCRIYSHLILCEWQPSVSDMAFLAITRGLPNVIKVILELHTQQKERTPIHNLKLLCLYATFLLPWNSSIYRRSWMYPIQTKTKARTRNSVWLHCVLQPHPMPLIYKDPLCQQTASTLKKTECNLDQILFSVYGLCMSVTEIFTGMRSLPHYRKGKKVECH